MFRAVKAIQATLEAAGDQEGEDAQEGLVQQALLRSCSHPALVAGDILCTFVPTLICYQRNNPCINSGQGEVLDPSTISVHSYLPLWTGLLQSNGVSGEKVKITECDIIMGAPGLQPFGACAH